MTKVTEQLLAKYYKHPTYKHVYGVDMKTPEGRLCWVSLVTPKPPHPENPEGQPRYEFQLLLDKTSKETAEFLAELDSIIKEMVLVYNDKRPTSIAVNELVKDGDAFDLEKYPYYKGMWVLTARNAKQITTLSTNEDGSQGPCSVDYPQGGMKAKAIIQPLITAHGASYKAKAVRVTEDDGVRYGGGGPQDYASMLDDEDTPVVAAPVADVAKNVAEVKVPVVASDEAMLDNL